MNIFRKILNDISKMSLEEMKVKEILETKDPKIDPAWEPSQDYDFNKKIPNDWLNKIIAEARKNNGTN